MLSKKILALAALAAIAQSAQADIVWNWSFAGETGQFVTDGTGGGAGTYNVIDFSVTSSAVGGTLGSLLGGQYTDGQFVTDMPYSFVYNGSAVTQWLHSGANSFDWLTFDSPTSSISYFFGWDSGNLNDPTKAAWWTGNAAGQHGAATVTVTVANAVPEPTPLALLALGLAGLALQARRRT
ncbi:PEP-CTERM sorting domain-containing protein [Aquincola sp. S2]|uniref:PEP-CTERM sorting domain-containing protein n=1 Tax=Pseudaquabacterium terrae TaxID=2732868 RepID=A0ABX2ECV8_9BURK|nr:PEP-CTERM sorting domain-containing protein [Aquabacterium terrae]NRF66297.1 PEP-CTERM sorting domain-containing protein [Aquabacterium terrae]